MQVSRAGPIPETLKKWERQNLGIDVELQEEGDSRMTPRFLSQPMNQCCCPSLSQRSREEQRGGRGEGPRAIREGLSVVCWLEAQETVKGFEIISLFISKPWA